MENIGTRIFLLRYRLSNKDKKLFLQIRIFIFFIILLILFILINIINPFTKIRNAYIEKCSLKNDRFVSESKTNKQYEDLKTNEKYVVPVNGVITSGYGSRQGGYHTGIDVSCYTHRDNVVSIADGIVTFSGSQSGYGNCIEIRHNIDGKTIYSFYAHLFNIKVSVGQNVKQSQIIASEGGDPYTDPNPGNSTGHHLHFEIRTKSGYGNDINPTFIFSKG